MRLFDIADVNKSASAFNVEKLTWLNQQHMMRAPASRIVPVLRWHLDREGIQAADEAQLEQIVLSQRERAKTVREMALEQRVLLPTPRSLRREGGAQARDRRRSRRCSAEASTELGQLSDWSAPAIHRLINGLATAKGISLGKLAQPIRLAVCGGTVSPPIDATLAILGRAESLSRLQRAIERWGAS